VGGAGIALDGRWDPDGLGVRAVCDAGASSAAKAAYLRMVGVSAAAALLLPAGLAAADAPVSWARPELGEAAAAALGLCCGGTLLLFAAAAWDSPPLLLGAGGSAAAVLCVGLTALCPPLPALLASGVAAALRLCLTWMLWLSLAAPLLYATLVALSALYGALAAVGAAGGGSSASADSRKRAAAFGLSPIPEGGRRRRR